MNTVAEMLLTQPAPMAIWATLLLLTFPALLLLGSPEAMSRPRHSAQQFVVALRGRGAELRRRAEEAARADQQATAEATRAQQYAAEVRVAADRADAAAQQWQELWERSETDRDDAYRAWLEADAGLRTAAAAAAWGTTWSLRTPDEYATRERFLHREVSAAVARGDLPAEALTDALAARNGWDPRLHPADQQLVIARASVAWRRHRYDQAVAAERRASHDVEKARRAASSLRHESRTAAVYASPAAPRGVSARPAGYSVASPAH
ncbi:hypothetical protein [Actinoplanes solisilvae]|uniref:hypothetical protein n=1 Tax=Actinoplanes solisilvae TaxID=2486853 RepID=UPI000FD81719|nr:hypothetical protein [Actinoplanes solisilvae]